MVSLSIIVLLTACRSLLRLFAQIILECANQDRSQIGAFIHRANLRGPPELTRKLDGRFYRVAVSAFCRQYGEQCKRSYGRTASSESTELCAHFYINIFKHATTKTFLRLYGFTALSIKSFRAVGGVRHRSIRGVDGVVQSEEWCQAPLNQAR